MNILVAGATGKVGRHLVQHLKSAGHRVRALTRDASTARFPAGVEVFEGDLMQPETLAHAFDGIQAAHLINFGSDYARLETGPQLVQLARRAGVQRVTILCDHEIGNLEEAVMSSDLGWTLLQPVGFMGNAIADWADSIRTEGVVRQAFVDGKGAVVHESDIAAVAAAALTQPGYEGLKLVITGPQALSIRQQIATIAAALGRDIPLIELTEAQARERWQAEGFSEDDIEFFVWMQSSPPPEGYTVVDTVERVTGRPARTFAQWVDEHLDHFR